MKLSSWHGRLLPLILGALVVVLTAGCSVVDVQRGPTLDANVRWTLLPVMNYAEAPRAGERVEAMLETLLRSRGVANLQTYPSPTRTDDLPELDERRRFESALGWARSNGFIYAVTGSVNEWRYKSGLDGEPAVGVGIRVIEITTGRTVWSASGAKTGWGRDSVSGTAQALLGALLDTLRLGGSKS